MYQYSKKDPPKVRFWARVNREAGADACWPWTGGKTSAGYGAIMVNYKNILAHRFSYELHNGPIPEGMFICHKCDNPACVNPTHLFLGTPQDNMDDMISKGRQVLTEPPTFFGEDHPNAALTWEQVDEMRQLFATGQCSPAELASRYHITKANVGYIIHWRTWRKDDSPPPEYPGKTKLTESEVRAIRSAYASGKVLQRELAAKYNVQPSLISLIVNRKRWAHI